MNAVVDVTKDRNLGLGGSEALAYCGRDRAVRPLQLYLRKVGEAGERPPEDARQEWGHRLEPVVRAPRSPKNSDAKSQYLMPCFAAHNILSF